MKNYESLPTVCIVGRPNVGKSSLFNVLLKERRAVVVGRPGTTRDRVESIITINEYDVRLVDTGGYFAGSKDDLSLQVKDQIKQAMKEASVILLVTDALSGISPEDEEVADILRKFSKQIILVANKADNNKIADTAPEFYRLGMGDPETISCLHRRGIRSLRERIALAMENFPGRKAESGEGYIRIAVVGRPNVGKSSLINYLLERDRVIVSDKPGTTRDSIDTYFVVDDKGYVLIDTAGMRHKRKIKDAVDVYSVMRSKESIERSDVAVLLLDAVDGITRDDLGILDFIEKSGKACLILVNKWDLAEETEATSMDEYKKHLVYAVDHLNRFPILFVSAKTGRNILDCLATINELNSGLDIKVATPYLNKIFEKKNPSKVPVPRRKKRPNFLYIVQSGSRPVEFKYFVNDPSSVLPTHISFIENQLRANLPLLGIPFSIKIGRSRKEKK